MGFFKKLFGLAQQPEISEKKKEPPFEIKITTNIGANNQSKFADIIQDKNSNWILNPAAPFPLTILSANKNIANQIRSILDDDQVYDYKKGDKIVAILAGLNVKIKEIEEYKKKYKPKYFQSLENQKNLSKEWNTASTLDKEDLLIEFRKNASNEIYERAACELSLLFENEPTDISIDDELIKEYGFDALKAYLRFADNVNKVRAIPNDNYNRPIFEKLVDLKLAKRGQEINIDDILPSLTLKELNSIADNQTKEFKRKNLAIEYLLSLGDVKERLSNKISLRELFQLKPLPEKFATIELQEIAKAWQYHDQEARLIIDTFRTSLYSMRSARESSEYVKSYSIEPLDKINPCPCAKDLSLKKFAKNNCPKLPLHMGCNCFLHTEYNF